MERRTRPMFFGGSRRFGHLLLSRSQAAIHPARRMRESIERRWGGRIRVRQPLSVKPLSSEERYRTANEHLALLSNLSLRLRRGLLLDVLARERCRW
jgi:hypothetical protein